MPTFDPCAVRCSLSCRRSHDQPIAARRRSGPLSRLPGRLHRSTVGPNAGTGAWDFPIGLAYSRFLTPRVTIDASVLYTFRTQHDYFKVGDRIDSGVALAYRLTERIKDFPQVSVFAELNDVHLFKDADHGTHDSNSGSNTLYLTPGGRIRFNKNWALTVAPSLPIYEHVNGDQGKVEFKMAVSLSFSN